MQWPWHWTDSHAMPVMINRFFSLRLVAPVTSFQGPRIDGRADTLPIPTRSMITGIVGAALGIQYDQSAQLQALQDSLRIAVVVHRAGTVEQDYQTVRMGMPHMVGPMWWHDGRRLGVMERAGGDPERTIIIERPLICDIDMTVVVELLADAPVAAEVILEALDTPAHPLSIGQRSCFPTGRVAGNLIDAENLLEAVKGVDGGGTVYLPVDSVRNSSAWGDLYVSVPAGRNWSSRQHGGTDTYVVRTVGA